MTHDQSEKDNQAFWHRIQSQPLDTEKSLEEFWQLIHEPDADYDSGILEYLYRERIWCLLTGRTYGNLSI